MEERTLKTTRTIQAGLLKTLGGPWVIEDVELAAPREDEVLVRVVGSGICQSDISCRDGHFPVPLPIVVGHEGSGVVEAVGSRVSRIKVGDHVVLSFDSCGGCPN